ncbi:endonuclease [Acinetobacter phage vB_AbaM_DLP2]|nr:endonuclease [Acinetobacter phage vB_AbaM_DLP2]
MHFYTYKITNLLNGKFYIGVHKTENLDDGYMGSGRYLNNSKSKHGVENFKKEILMFHDSEDEMFEMEALIVDQEFVDRKDTYNLKLGGQGGWDFINATTSHETRVLRGRLGAITTNKKRATDPSFNAMWMRNLSTAMNCPKRKARISNSLKDRFSRTGGTWLGKTHKPETIEKVKNTFAEINHQQGEKNSQFGKMWIHSLELRKSTRINKTDPIPEGWNKGRKMFKE